jgi:hypothetical protein
MKEKILLIAGCSHAAGSEMDGSQDSEYNRKNSFGNLLADKINRKAINIASNGSSNQTIARTVIEWFSESYNPETMDIFVLVAWTESSRIDLPMFRTTWHEQWNPYSDYISAASRDYIRVNLGYKGSDTKEQEIIKQCQEFIVNNMTFIEILSANLVLQLQYFFKANNIDYIMCNTMHMFGNDQCLNFYIDNIDKTYYLNIRDNDKCFYYQYKNLGYINKKATYWHHDELPHNLFSIDLFNFYLNKYIHT